MNIVYKEWQAFVLGKYLRNIWKLVIFSPIERQAVKIICAKKLRQLHANIPKISSAFNQFCIRINKHNVAVKSMPLTPILRSIYAISVQNIASRKILPLKVVNILECLFQSTSNRTRSRQKKIKKIDKVEKFIILQYKCATLM